MQLLSIAWKSKYQSLGETFLSLWSWLVIYNESSFQIYLFVLPLIVMEFWLKINQELGLIRKYLLRWSHSHYGKEKAVTTRILLPWISQKIYGKLTNHTLYIIRKIKLIILYSELQAVRSSKQWFVKYNDRTYNYASEKFHDVFRLFDKENLDEIKVSWYGLGFAA